jgi:hypothetical protein
VASNGRGRLLTETGGIPDVLRCRTHRIDHCSRKHHPVSAPVRQRGFKGTTLDDLSSRDQRLPKAGKAPDIIIKSSVGDRGETFIRRVSVVIEGFRSATDPISNPPGVHDKIPGCFFTSFIVVK